MSDVKNETANFGSPSFADHSAVKVPLLESAA